ncbi:MAG: glucokinase [Colwellia sp.]|nr:glucokinase [Colwellia sp.]
MNTLAKNTINLIADIGGTNIRLALADKSCKTNYKEIETYRCADFANLIDIIALYIDKKQLNGLVINACLAIACPVDNDLISMTNLPWQFSQTDLKSQLKLNSLTLINDYTAIAMAIPLLDDEQKVKIGGGEMVANKPISVCGPGTGLGVANLIPVSTSGVSQWHCVSGEGGHVDFAPVGEQEIAVLRYLNTIKKRVSYEQLLSGYGIEQIYQALVNKGDGEQQPHLSAQEISKQGIENTCPFCHQTLLIFCQTLGSFAGNLALIMNSQGGVYIAGGIVPRFIDFLKESKFRERFETKGRLSNITLQTPTYVITEQQPGLLGAAAYLFQQ